MLLFNLSSTTESHAEMMRKVAYLVLGLWFWSILSHAQTQTVTIEGTIRVGRNWTELTTAAISGETGASGVASKVIFESTVQSVLTPTATSAFYNVEVNKTSGSTPSNYLQLAANATLKNDLTLTAGVVNANAKSLTLNKSAASAITFAAGTGIYAETAPTDVDPLGGVAGPGYGYVKWKISNSTGNYTVPFITATGADVRLNYDISVAGNAGGQINFSTYGTAANNKPWALAVTQFDAGGADGSAKVANRFYIVEQNSYTTRPKGWLTFKYLTTELDPGLAEVRLAAQRFNPNRESWGDWLYSPTANTIAKTVSIFMANNSDYFDAWVLADQSAPLPIELVAFDAKANDNQVDLTWTTAAEINSDFFTVERTKDGVAFEDVLTVKGAGFSNNYLNYSATDFSPEDGLSYYRLKNTDIDGKADLSELKPVIFKRVAIESNRSIEIYPNPNKGDMFNLEMKGFSKEEPVLVVIQDMAGRVYYSKITYVNNEWYVKAIENENNLTSGIYLVVASSENNIYSKKMVVE